MRIALLASTGANVGLGHLKRCLCIAEELKSLSYKVEFLIESELHSNLIYDSGFIFKRLVKVGQGYEMIIVDKYCIDESVLAQYKKKCKILVRIDDAAPVMVRDRISDVLINGNPYAHAGLYNNYVKKGCHLIVGGKFTPMDRKFRKIRSRYKVRKNINHIAVAFGSSDNGIMNYAYKISRKLLFASLPVNVFVLNGKRLGDKFNRIDFRHKMRLLPYVDNISSIFRKADIAVCSASTTCWQLAAIGIPFIAFKIADNQSLAFEHIKRTKIGIALDSSSIHNGKLEREILGLSRSKRQLFSKMSRKNIDCRGAERIALELERILLR